MEKVKNKVGRPKGFKLSDETKKKIGQSMKYYYANMTEQQKKVRTTCNRIKSELYKKAMEDYYNNLLNFNQ